MKYLIWGAAGAVALVAIVFGIANREMVTLSLSPLPFALDMPLFVALELMLLIGFIFGGVFSWARAGQSRRLARPAWPSGRRAEARDRTAETAHRPDHRKPRPAPCRPRLAQRAGTGTGIAIRHGCCAKRSVKRPDRARHAHLVEHKTSHGIGKKS